MSKATIELHAVLTSYVNKNCPDAKAEVKIYIFNYLFSLYRLTKIIHGIWNKWHEELGKDHARIVCNTCTT